MLILNKLQRRVDRMKEGILVTGATGFLGIHIVKELVMQLNQRIYCLVRGKTIEDAKDKFRQLLKWYFNEQYAEILGRVTLICGDFTKDYFGLSREKYEELGKNIVKVIHTGAIVKHFGIMEDYRLTNVTGTKNMVDFCKRFDAFLLFTSSVAVLNYMDTSEACWTYQDEKKVDLYVWSKIIAEKTITEAMKQGLKASILRIGALFGRYEDGVFQKNISENAVCARIKTMIVGGKLPTRFLDSNVELMPVDYCSKVIVYILLEEKEGFLCLYNNNTVIYRELIEILKKLGYPVISQDYQDFLSFANDLKEYPLKRELFTGFYFHYKRRRNNQRKPQEVNCEITERYLKSNQMQWPKITTRYIEVLINHMRKQGYLPE